MENIQVSANHVVETLLTSKRMAFSIGATQDNVGLFMGALLMACFHEILAREGWDHSVIQAVSAMGASAAATVRARFGWHVGQMQGQHPEDRPLTPEQDAALARELHRITGTRPPIASLDNTTNPKTPR